MQGLLVVALAILGGGLIGNILNYHKVSTAHSLSAIHAAKTVIDILTERQKEETEFYKIRIAFLEEELTEIKTEISLLRSELKELKGSKNE